MVEIINSSLFVLSLKQHFNFSIYSLFFSHLWPGQAYLICKYILDWITITLAGDIWNHWTAVSTLLGLISSVYCDLPYWRWNQQPQNAEPKLCHWATGPHSTQVMPNYVAQVFARFSGHGNSIYNIIPLFKKENVHVNILSITSRRVTNISNFV